MTTHRSPAGARDPRTALRVAGCTVLGAIGAVTAGGCLLTLFLEHLVLFGDRPRVPAPRTASLLAGAAAAILVPAFVALRVLHTWGRRLVVAAAMLAVLLLGAVPVAAVLGVR